MGPQVHQVNPQHPPPVPTSQPAPPGPYISPQFPFQPQQQPQLMPQPSHQEHVAQLSPEMIFAQGYADEIKTMFMSADFKESAQQQRREMVGSAIYKYVE